MTGRSRVAVVVLGDLARSPRMTNHARELARAGFDVVLIGYREREFEPPEGVRVRPLRPLRRAGERRSKLTFLCGSALRMGLLSGQLAAALARERWGTVLVQNPPAFPTLAASWLAARWSRARLVVDWHNYGYTLLALRLGAAHPIVRLATWYEAWAGRLGDDHFCVSQAMRTDLAARFGIKARLLYDRPVELSSAPRQQSSRLVVVCPSGWTADEDMRLLLDALEMLPPRAIEVHLTGDGPLRESLEPRIAGLRRSGMEIHTGFLAEADYRALLRRADVGLSAHRSSSGVDLAMKVVDLYGAGVPVCALDYGGSLGEQVLDGVTGCLFRTAGELAAALAGMLSDRAKLEAWREAARGQWGETWAGAWQRVAAPVFGNNDE